MTDGDKLRLMAKRFEHFRGIYASVTEADIAELRHAAERLDAWDKELAHIAVENCDD